MPRRLIFTIISCYCFEVNLIFLRNYQKLTPLAPFWSQHCFAVKVDITKILLREKRPSSVLTHYNHESGFACSSCGRCYKLKSSLRNHQKWECGKEPQFECLFCSYKAKQKMHMLRHMERMHKELETDPSMLMDFNISEVQLKQTG